jgi:hypothetical protein
LRLAVRTHKYSFGTVSPGANDYFSGVDRLRDVVFSRSHVAGPAQKRIPLNLVRNPVLGNHGSV